MILGLQIRAARAALGWSAQELSEKSGISWRTIMRMEQEDGIPASRVNTVVQIQTALESAGIEFIGSLGNQPGVRLK